MKIQGEEGFEVWSVLRGSSDVVMVCNEDLSGFVIGGMIPESRKSGLLNRSQYFLESLSKVTWQLVGGEIGKQDFQTALEC